MPQLKWRFFERNRWRSSLYRRLNFCIPFRICIGKR